MPQDLRMDERGVTMRYLLASLLVAFAMSAVADAEVTMQPFVMDWRDNAGSLVDLSSFLDAPAGKNGHVGIKDGHLVTPEGRRLRIWGVNFTGAACFPAREDAPMVAAHLARFGINCVRFHFLDSGWSASLLVRGRDDTRALDPKQLDTLDYFVAELKKRGIYSDLNLNVGRTYRKGDGVRDYEYLGMAKVVNYFDEQVQMLHKEYARQLLTHRNPYTGAEYRHEPAVAIVELVNENSIVEAWFSDRLLGKNTQRNPGTWTDITAWYAEELTAKYNQWLKETLSAEELSELRKMAGVAEGQPIPRLSKAQFKDAPAKRFHTEAAFYMHLERDYFGGMYKYLKNDLGVKALVAGTSDHNHYNSGYPLLASTSQCDIIDGHVYWQHPNYFQDPKTGKQGFSIANTPMVDDPANSTVVQLSRSPVAGKPYTVSEINHPAPNEYACEGFGIFAAYAAFQDWDGVFFYTFEHKVPSEWTAKMPSHFEVRPDPVKMMNIAAGACLFLRGDVQPAKETVYRSYSPEEVRESIRLPSSQRPFFTPGFDPATALVHATRIRSFDVTQPLSQERLAFEKQGQDGLATQGRDALATFVSDTGQLAWHHAQKRQGFITIETDRSQALIGFTKYADKPLKSLSATVENEFCSIILTSLNDKPIAQTDRLLLVATARAANSDMKWNEKRTSLTDWGAEPTLIEPVKGFVTLKGINTVEQIEMTPLDSGAKPLGKPIPAEKTPDGYRLPLGDPATPWYLIRITHNSVASNEAAIQKTPAADQVWVKCAKCGLSYQMDVKEYYRGLEEKARANPSPIPVALPLQCAKCGQDGIRKAFKCDQCGEVFFANSVPADFEDRCPKCGYSKVEAVRKARSGGRVGP
jgi:hypothetical protein